MYYDCLHIAKHDLAIEEEQIKDEGKRLPPALAKELKALKRCDLSKPKGQERARRFMEATLRLNVRKDFPYHEPSDLKSIRKARPKSPELRLKKLTRAKVKNHLLGAWQGRCAGCLLGKPVEGWRTERLWPFLKETDQFPLDNYITAEFDDSLLEKYNVGRWAPFINRVDHMVEDDDTNYTVTGLAILQRRGPDFKPADVADFWIRNIPIMHTCTAERVAYHNIVNGFSPPESATVHNPYREWIGAQIRADFFGYAALGNPELAADFAWRDASISHIKNGIYGEMWVAAMLAAAPFCSSPDEVIVQGLAQIPKRCRLASEVKRVQQWCRQGISYDDAVARIHQQWDEHSRHHWCHTISNAMLVSIGLLWGDKDLGLSMCRAVQPGFDTDCNGATVGSIVGMMRGAKTLSPKWAGPLNDRLSTGVQGYHEVKISELAEQSFAVYETVRKHG